MEDRTMYHGGDDDEPMELPPGFRFHPTDEELITHYLTHKVADGTFSSRAIGDVDLNKCEPWDLPKKAKMGEDSWYFFCVRDRKYPTGLRTNRATEAGYWKATGKDKEIFRGKTLVGMKKTLVFYMGRAPRGEKSNWVMHEYRLEGKFPPQVQHTPSKNEWVISRVFHKTSAGKKTHYPDTMICDLFDQEIYQNNLPPLMDSSPYYDQTKPGIQPSVHVPCFSTPTTTTNNNAAQTTNMPIFEGFNMTTNDNNSNNQFFFPRSGGMFGAPFEENMVSEGTVRSILENSYGSVMKQRMKPERDMGSVVEHNTFLNNDMNVDMSSDYEMGKCPIDDDRGDPSSSIGLVDIDSFWN
ncbi:hypothetical protein Droror1_Dr00021114 [Drosera rotundifolia]